MTEIEKILFAIVAFIMSALIAILSNLIINFVLTKAKRSWYVFITLIFLCFVILLTIKGYFDVINVYYTFNEHLFINLLPLIIAVGLSPNLYLFFMKLENDYLDGDRLMHWSDVDFTFLKKKDWNVKVYQNIKATGCLQLSKNELSPTIIFSVSANKRYHEVAFFNLLAARYAIRLHAMDLNVFKEQEIIPVDERFINYKGRYDASNLKDTLHDLNINKLNIIFDRKGCLWYSTIKNNTISQLQTYYDCLQDGGYVIIDAEDTKHFKRKMSYLQMRFKFLMRKNIKNITIDYSTEASTYQKISCYVDSHFSNKFDVFLIGEGIYKVAVLRKISAL